MTRRQLEHILRAAGDIADDDELIVVGSQAILGQFPDAPATLLVSNEADIYPKNKPELADLIDGSIGEGSPFHDTFGYYAQGVGPTTAVLAPGWENRLVAISGPGTRGITGYCLEVHDLALAKAVAGRDKDRRFLRELAQHNLVRCELIEQRLALLDIVPEVREATRQRVLMAFA